MTVFERSALAVCLALLVTACGRKGALIYPDMMAPAAPDNVYALQSGSAVKLRFSLPDKDRSGRPLPVVAGVRISRRAAATGRKDLCRTCTTDYSLVQTIYLDHMPAATQRVGNRLVLLDGDVTAGSSYSYRVASFTADGVDGAAAPTADVPVTPPLSAPLLRIESFPTEVRLQFSSQPLITGRLLGYNLYRRSDAVLRPYEPLNREPLQGKEYVDATLERGVKYRYSARALIVMVSGDVAESAESEEVEGMLKDDE